jgi:hypothetical protein
MEEASKTVEINLPSTEVGAASEVEIRTGEDVVDTMTTRCVEARVCAAEDNTTKLKVSPNPQ